MSVDSVAQESTAPNAPSERRRTDDWRRTSARLGIAMLGSAAACLAMWSVVPRSLPRPTGIVGYPVFANYPFMASFWAYRLVVDIFPIVAIALFALLTWWGPLRRPVRPSTGTPVALVDPDRDPPGKGWWGVLARTAAPTGVVVMSAAVRGGDLISRFTVACGLLYLIVVGAAAAAGTWWSSRRPAEDRPERRAIAFWPALAVANGAGGAIAAIAGVWFVSDRTVMIGRGFEHHYPWLPWWLAILGILAVSWWTVRQLRAGRPARAVERTLGVHVVGSVAVFLATSRLIGNVAGFQGFDDAQHMTGGDLLNRGFMPWRDQLFIHGLFADVLQANVAMHIFGTSVWGAWTGLEVLVTPLAVVGLYLFAVWVSNGNPWFAAFFGVAFLGMSPYLDTRFVLVPVSLILLGATLRRTSRGWSVGLTLVLFVQAILVPETTFLALPALACVVAADLRHRRPGLSLWQALLRSRWCAGTGVVALVILGVVLAASGTLRPFVDYYVIFGPGHNEAGALPLSSASTRDFRTWGAGIVAVLLTIAAVAWRMYRRTDWSSRDWVAVALAGFLAFYEEKALGRFDTPHVGQVFQVAIPLILYWLWKVAGLTDVMADRLRWRVPRPGFSARATAAAALVLAVVLSMSVLQSRLEHLGDQHRVRGSVVSGVPRIGYARTGWIDATMIADLDTTLRTYAGADKPVFDMTSSLGYIYFLLQRVPGTRFTHVDMAIPPGAQRILIDELKESRPPVVVFDAWPWGVRGSVAPLTLMGLPSWDDIRSNIRHYEVSQYILDGWVPVLRTHGTLILLRRDLAAGGVPMPALQEPPLTTDLWFSGSPCDWGASPNYLDSVATGPSVDVPITSWAPKTIVDVSGWAVDSATGTPARSVVLVDDGEVVASAAVSGARPDVATTLAKPAARDSGFQLTAALAEGARPALYLLGADNKLHPVPGSPPGDAKSVRFPDGRVVPVAGPVGGGVEAWRTTTDMVGRIDLPAGVNLVDYPLATLSSDAGDLGDARIAITDGDFHTSHRIAASSLPGLAPDLPIRVGSCLQWRGYDTRQPLYVMQQGGEPATKLTLSGVRPAR
ncbi:hypothetical protein Drose_17345 [Dactylosporangium roseum]|uniref:Uncharacterized protein n=1 Tax=Dactylosporangium roseum TaxID=47989 RepID=A0ABY5ZGE8_9ACTN|nr:hypothetical protein [Dactylosporangium roseum]UWZ39822.1 hypothetical protein Drose_17345 [Dactylosporangium roseum]